VPDASETRYAKTAAGGYVAYQVIGNGPIDVLVTHVTAFPIDLMWDEPRLAYFLNRLSSFSRHIWFDPRGTGASDGIPHEEGRLTESVLDDILAVLDEIGCEHVALLGLGVPTGLLFAATHPERTSAVVLVNATARLRRADDYPQGLPEALVDQGLAASKAGPLSGLSALVRQASLLAPSVADDLRFQRWLARAGRLTCSPEDQLWRVRNIYDIDLRDALPAIGAPTLVVGRRDRRVAAQTRFIADQIAGAKYVELLGADVLPFVGDVDGVLDPIE